MRRHGKAKAKGMTKQAIFEFFKIGDLLDLPAAIWTILSLPKEERDRQYRRLLAVNGHDLSYEWFQEAYEEELAQRKKSKQDFTPKEVAQLCSQITGTPRGIIHEPTAGNGSMIIADWWVRCRKGFPWEFFPSENMVDCWELSDRSVPILLLNLSIRGIMGYVHHGDVLEKTEKARYVLLNRRDDAFAFSEVIRDENMRMRIIKDMSL